jgi:hypothetical protein
MSDDMETNISFQNHIQDFMDWFCDHYKEIEHEFDSGRYNKMNNVMKEKLDNVLPGIMFRISKRPDNGNYMLEFNTRLEPMLKILCADFCRQLPSQSVPRWTFYWSHPACRGSFKMGSEIFKSGDIFVSPQYDDKRKKVNLEVRKTEKFLHLDDQQTFTVLYMMLSDYLGEAAVDIYVGNLQFQKKKLGFRKKATESFTLNEFARNFEKERKLRKWPDPESILVMSTNYLNKTKNYDERKDITEGVTLCSDLLTEEHRETRPHFQLLDRFGVGFFSAVAELSAIQSKDERNSIRIGMEKRLREILGENDGIIVNSALGNAHAYVDFFVYRKETLDDIEKEYAQAKGYHLTVL